MADDERFDRELRKLFDWVTSEGRDIFNDGFERSLRNSFVGSFDAHLTLEHPKSENNEFLTKLADQARALSRSIESLTKHDSRYPRLAYTHMNFMGAAWGLNRIVPEQTALLDALANIEKSAQRCMLDNTNGASRKTGKRRIVEGAFDFFLEFGTVKPTETPDGTFSVFCREFYHRATGIDLDDRQNDNEPGLGRQIKDVIKSNRAAIDAKWP
ncbi:hypothetical protein GCM10007881_28070 [Mesorhizobium huakuii]|uniref:hypothetical protein n=1 Tax=Mesorhizobium huakuii TaxID=28104 RepID=UPI00235C37CB|nr:hypothetical protein [Mesorhizobium huakuii]GLQ79289.1 hypothetical protein GCM10007881_28070 [Mesorhizobium huakuii]